MSVSGHTIASEVGRDGGSPSDLLHEAAALMRHRAQESAPGPWESSANSDDQWFVYGIHLEGEVSAEVFVHDGNRRTELDASAATAQHIASWHPAVALAVADWLEVAAVRYDTLLDTFAPGSRAGAVTASENVTGWAEALAVARVYLGRES